MQLKRREAGVYVSTDGRVRIEREYVGRTIWRATVDGTMLSPQYQSKRDATEDAARELKRKDGTTDGR